MTYIDTTDLDLGDWVTLRDILNKEEKWQVISTPKDSGLQGGLLSCLVRKGPFEKQIYFNKK